MKARSFWLAILGSIALLLLLGILGSLAPDRELHFEREVPAQAPREEITKRMLDLDAWPKWHHLISRAELTDGASLSPGARIKLTMKPKPWREFVSVAEVIEAAPSGRLKLRLLEDGSGKLEKSFEGLEWTVELVQKNGALWVRGNAQARTRSWRSRLVSRVAERAVMNQVFYPDLTRLADPSRDEVANPVFDPPPPRKGS